MGTVVASLVYFALVWQHGDGSSYHLSFLGRNHSGILSPEIGSLVIKTSGSVPKIENSLKCTDFNWEDHSAVKLAKLNNCTGLIPNGVELGQNGFIVESSDDFSLHVYQNDNYGNSGDGYLAIPDEHLGDEYIVATYCTLGGMCQFAITAIEDSTYVGVVFPVAISQSPKCVNGTAIPFMINEGETLHFESDNDLSGTYITADKDVGVFVGARDVPVANSDMTTNMIEQIIPVNKWGTEFVVMPNYLNKAGDVIKIVTKTDSTLVHIVGYKPFMIKRAGDAVERRIDWQVHSWIVTSNPVMIIQIMSVDLYNDADDVTDSPSLVLVPHVGQWVDEAMYFHCTNNSLNNFALVTDTTDNVSHNSSVTSYVEWEKIEGSNYSVMITRANTSLIEIDVHSGTKVSGYGFCNGNTAVLLAADWSQENSECTPTAPAPGDDIDNDCNGLIDDFNCTEDDLNVLYELVQNAGGNISYKLLAVKGINQVKFNVKTCDVASITLKKTTAPYESLSIIISASDISYLAYSTDGNTAQISSDNVTINWNCTQNHSFSLNWEASTGFLVYEGKFLNVTTNVPSEFDEMILSAFVGHARFVVDLPEKDCGKVYRGARTPDSFGSEFLIPVTDSDDDFRIGLTNNGPNSVNCYLTTETSELKRTVGSNTTEWIESSDVNSTHYIGIHLWVENSEEVSVYVMRESATKHMGFSVIPLDVLGPSYHMITPEPEVTADTCEVWSLGRDTEITGIGTVQAGEKKEFNPRTVSGDLHYGNLLNAERPVAMFCGLPGAFVQIPPRETLSKKHYIPMIDLTILSATATIYVVAVEDSTVLIIKGDYHQLDSVSLTGDVYERTLEPDTIYEIEATKPVQVHLKISSTNWQSAIVIPPVDQYKENTVLFVNDTGLTIRSSSGVNESGANVTLPDNVETIPEKMFAVVFFEKTAGIINVVTNQQNYADINEFCEITLGSPGDKVDNDCDGLVDEEECATTITPGTIDVDIDGDINEDCADGTSAPPSSNILLNVEYSLTSCANGGGNGPGNEGSGDEGSGENTEDGTGSLISETMTTVTEYKDKEGPYIQDTEHIRTVAPIVLSPPIDFNTPTTTPAPGSTAAPAESCTVDCYCPCGWVEEPKDYTKAEIQTKVKEIQEKLTVSKDTLSATIRKKVSAKDDRASATTVGWAAVVWLGTMIGAIVLLDISSVVRDLKMLVNNLRQVF